MGTCSPNGGRASATTQPISFLPCREANPRIWGPHSLRPESAQEPRGPGKKAAGAGRRSPPPSLLHRGVLVAGSFGDFSLGLSGCLSACLSVLSDCPYICLVLSVRLCCLVCLSCLILYVPMSVCLSLCLSCLVCPYVCRVLSVCLVYLSICLFLSCLSCLSCLILSVSLSCPCLVCLSVCLFVLTCLSVPMSVPVLSVCPSSYLSVRLSVCPRSLPPSPKPPPASALQPLPGRQASKQASRQAGRGASFLS